MSKPGNRNAWSGTARCAQMRKTLVIAVGIMALAMLTATRAKADAVTVTLTSTPSGTISGLPDFTTVEGSGPCSFGQCLSLLDFTVTNNSGSSLLTGLDEAFPGFPIVGVVSFPCSLNPLPNGESCTGKLGLYTAPATDHDFGTVEDSINVTWSTNASNSVTSVDLYLTVEPPGSMPEPSSFLLLRSGLLLPMLRQRFSRL